MNFILHWTSGSGNSSLSLDKIQFRKIKCHKRCTTWSVGVWPSATNCTYESPPTSKMSHGRRSFLLQKYYISSFTDMHILGWDEDCSHLHLTQTI